MDGLFTLEWSKRQGMFHIQPLTDTLRKNREAFVRNSSVDYLPIHIGPREECQAAADKLRPILMANDKAAA